MLLLFYDTETTGLDVVNDRVIEVGLVLYTTGQRRVLESSSFLIKSNVPISAESSEKTGITQTALDRFGYDSEDSFNILTEDYMKRVDAIVAHNGNRFDKRITESWGRLHGKSLPDKLWIDTMTDIPGVEGKRLMHMAAEHGFLPMEEHSALADAQTVLKILSRYDIQTVAARAQSQTVVVQAHQKRDANDQAKKLKFRWNPDYKVWWKAMKETDVEEFSKTCPFDISIEEKYSLDELWDS